MREGHKLQKLSSWYCKIRWIKMRNARTVYWIAVGNAVDKSMLDLKMQIQNDQKIMDVTLFIWFWHMKVANNPCIQIYMFNNMAWCMVNHWDSFTFTFLPFLLSTLALRLLIKRGYYAVLSLRTEVFWIWDCTFVLEYGRNWSVELMQGKPIVHITEFVSYWYTETV
jgi:hypothetical protein